MAKDPPKIPQDFASGSEEKLPLTPEAKVQPLEPKIKKEVPWKIVIPAVLAVLMLISAGVFYYFYYYKGFRPAQNGDENLARNIIFSTPAPKDLPTPKPTPTPTPIVLRPDNGTKGTYLISQVKNGGPVVKQVVFDPLDVKKGQSFTVTITMDAESSADQITGVFESDTIKKNITFEKIAGVQGAQSWQAKFTIEDTVLWKYMLTFIAKAGDRSSTVTVAPRS